MYLSPGLDLSNLISYPLIYDTGFPLKSTLSKLGRDYTTAHNSSIYSPGI